MKDNNLSHNKNNFKIKTFIVKQLTLLKQEQLKILLNMLQIITK